MCSVSTCRRRVQLVLCSVSTHVHASVLRFHDPSPFHTILLFLVVALTACHHVYLPMQSLKLQARQKYLEEYNRQREEQWALWEKRLQEEERKERLQLFKNMDTDKSHPKWGLNSKELRAVLKNHGDYTDDAALKALFDAMDDDGNGDISFEEANAYEDKQIASESITWESLENAASSAAAVAASAASSAAAVVSEGASAAAAAAAETTFAYEVCRVADSLYSFRSRFYTSALLFPQSRSASFAHFYTILIFVTLSACHRL